MIAPGHYPDMTNEEYHSGPGISKSHLDVISPDNGGCPRKYWAQYVAEGDDRIQREEKKCWNIGDGTHKMVLEPGTFEDTYRVGFDKAAHPDALDTVEQLKSALVALGQKTSGAKGDLIKRLLAVEPNARVMQRLKDDYDQLHSGKVEIDASDYRDMLGMLRAVHAHPVAGKIFANGVAEQSYFSIDPDTGLLTKCRPDWITDQGAHVDLKSTDNASPRAFGRSVANYRYYLQPPWYGDVYERVTGEFPTAWVFVAVEKRAPYSIGIYYATAEQIQRGRDQYRSDLSLISRCYDEGVWPDYGHYGPSELSLPAWVGQG